MIPLQQPDPLLALRLDALLRKTPPPGGHFTVAYGQELCRELGCTAQEAAAAILWLHQQESEGPTIVGVFIDPAVQ
jgi:hypothetical protein